MTDREELMKKRSELIRKSSKETCWPCEDPRKQNKIMRYDDPITSGCMCEKIEPIVAELKEVEAKMGLKRR
ncbi:hypothetical protein ACFL12_04255 [Pseudomonadota bacterium]